MKEKAPAAAMAAIAIIAVAALALSLPERCDRSSASALAGTVMILAGCLR